MSVRPGCAPGVPWVFKTTLIGRIPYPRPCRASFFRFRMLWYQLKGMLTANKDPLKIFRQKLLLLCYTRNAPFPQGAVFFS